MTIKPLNQRDARWKNKYLGFSKLTIGNYGCTITCLTMLINFVEGKNYGVDEVNDKLKTAKAFQGALLIWSRVPLAFPSLKWVKRGYNYNNIEVAFNVYVNDMPVMVEVNGAKIGASKHWVLFTGSGKANDPWFGKVISTSMYPLTGYAIYGRK